MTDPLQSSTIETEAFEAVVQGPLALALLVAIASLIIAGLASGWFRELLRWFRP